MRVGSGGWSRPIGGRGGGHGVGSAGRINVTPMIDVIMVLIVFYLIVGQLASDRLTPVDLPGARAGVPEPPGSETVVTLSRSADGGVELRVEGEPVRRSELVSRLDGRAVVLRADRALAMRDVRPVLDACRGAGVRGVRLAAQDASIEGTAGASP